MWCVDVYKSHIYIELCILYIYVYLCLQPPRIVEGFAVAAVASIV